MATRIRIALTDRAREELRSDEVVLIDWQVTGLCCADAGEFDVRPIRRLRLPSGMREIGDHVAVHPMALAQLVEITAQKPVTIDCKQILFGRVRRFKTDLPSDAGLRSCFGRLHVGSQA